MPRPPQPRVTGSPPARPAAAGSVDERWLEKLVRAVAGIELGEVPAEVRLQGARVVADTVGVAIAGGRRPEVRRLAADPATSSLGPPSPTGTSTVLVPGRPRRDMFAAALVNGTAIPFLELDEGVRPTGHPSAHVLPAALATAQSLRVTGERFLIAFLTGYEVAARLFEAFRLTYPLHPHGHLGAVGAAVAVARLRDRDPVAPAEIAATLPILAVWQSSFEGATARTAQVGLASAIGVLANTMAEAGFTGSKEALPAAFGDLVGTAAALGAAPQETRDRRWRIAQNYFKFHSACALTHSALDAVLDIGPVPVDEVLEVEVETVSSNMKVARLPRPNEHSTRFSLPYAVAAALVHGHTEPHAFVPDKRVFRLARRVDVRVAEELESGWPASAPARVTVRMRGGTLERQADNPHGHYKDPPTTRELEEKFCRLVTEGEGGRALFRRILDLERVADMNDLFG